MIEAMINWIDKDLDAITDRSEFKFFFGSTELVKGEDTFYLTNTEEGIEIVMPLNLIVDTIHLFPGGYQGYKSFSFPLPFNILFSSNQNDVQSVLGQPNKTGGGQDALYLGPVAIWDKYYFNGYSIHFRYSDDRNSVSMVTLGSLKLEDYFNSEFQ